MAGEYSKYYTGEAYWALARLHRAFPGEGWGEAADRIGAYLATSRDEVEDHWPPIPDHWAAYGMAETVEFPERGRPPLTERRGGLRAPAGRAVRRPGPLARASATGRGASWCGAPTRARGGWYGVVGEALTGLVARRAGGAPAGRPARADRRTRDLHRRTGRERAIRRGGCRRAPPGPERVEGAWFRDGETRMDDQQHALAGLLRTIPIVEAATRGPGARPSPATTRRRPGCGRPRSLLALNPARAAFGVPRAGGRRGPSLGVAAVGGAIGGLAVCAAAALGDPLLDALDVSEPSFRIAAGIVAALAGAADLFRRPPPPEPALAGWRAALVPVAIPLVARPALLVLALGAGADRGVLVSAGAMAIGVALLTGAGGRRGPTEGPRGPGPPLGRPPAGRRARRLRGRPRRRRGPGRLGGAAGRGRRSRRRCQASKASRTTAGGTVPGRESTTRKSWLKACAATSVATAASAWGRRSAARMAPTSPATK